MSVIARLMRVRDKPIAAMDSCFGIAGPHQHGVQQGCKMNKVSVPCIKLFEASNIKTKKFMKLVIECP